MSDENTRDIAVATAAQVNAHVVDCLEVRKRNEKKLDLIDVKLNKIALILGGIVIITHSTDWVLKFLGY